MPLYWLCYRHPSGISVVIEPGASLIHAVYGKGRVLAQEIHEQDGNELPKNRHEAHP
jgi:hypothetical protein